jgi:hypothetical protein
MNTHKELLKQVFILAPVMDVERPCAYCWMVVMDGVLGDANMGPGDMHFGIAVVAAGAVLPLNHAVA